MPIGLPPGEMVADGTLSGSGDLAFLVTTTGRLLKCARSTGTVIALLPATPYVNDLFGLAPGTFFRLRGSLTGSAADWTGRILLDGQSVPVVYARTGEVAIQVPWEQRVGALPFRLDMPGDSPFAQVQTVTIYQQLPLPLAVIRGDWSGLLDTPPGPGDIVHIYMTGLGPVNGTPQTGTPTPLVTLNPIQGTIRCGFDTNEDSFATDAETLFAGLAPGTIGVYQVSVRLPAQVHDTLSVLTCTLKGKNGEESTFIEGLPLP